MSERPSAASMPPDGERRSEEPTAPFLLERSSPDLPQPELPPTAAPGASEASATYAMAQRLGIIVLVNATLYAAIAAAGAVRYAGDRSAIPEVVLAIIALGLTVWGTLSGYHLLRASRGGKNAGHQLAGAFSNLRSIFVLKGTGLFLVLALSCFAFSAILSLIALL